MKKKVIAAGHICIDVTPAFPDRRVSEIGEILRPGKLVETGPADVHTGGAVANTGLAMKILGADVQLMGKIGRDSFGDMVRSILEKYDAADSMICDENESTSYSVVLAVPGIDRIFLHNPGANNSFCADDVSEEALTEASLFHFGYPPLMAGMFENGGRELIRLMKKAKASGTATSLDLAAVDPAAPAGKQDWEQILRDTLPYVDIFVPSIEEVCYMIDRERFDEWQLRAGTGDITQILDFEKDIIPLAKKCMSYGVKVLLLKCGAKGMYCCTAGRNGLKELAEVTGIDTYAWADFSEFEVSYVPDRVLSGTGAGDTSIAAFLTAMLEGYGPEDSLHLAAATGASCVAEYDALSGLKSLEELKARIDAGWEKYAAE